MADPVPNFNILNNDFYGSDNISVYLKDGKITSNVAYFNKLKADFIKEILTFIKSINLHR